MADDDQSNGEMLRDLGVSMVVGEACEYALKTTVKKGVNAIALRAAGKAVKVSVTKNTLKQIVKAVKSRVIKMIKEIVQKGIIKTIKKLLAKAAAKVGTGVAKSAATSGAVAASGCVGGPAGCAAGAAVGTALFIWDCSNIIWDLMDTRGLQIVFTEDMIRGIGDGIRDSVNDAFAEYSDTPYLDTEIFFEPLALVFSADENNELVLSEEWGDLYQKHVNHYMTEIKGHPPNWEELLPEPYDIGSFLDDPEESPVVSGPSVTTSKFSPRAIASFIIFIIMFIIGVIFL